MKVTHKIQKITDISELVSVVVENEDAIILKQEFDDKLISNSQVQGFRKGKAPLQVVIGKIGKDVYYKDLREHIASKALTEALKESELSPVVKPKYEFADWEEGGKFVFTATIFTEPKDTQGDIIENMPDPSAGASPERYSDAIHGIPGQMPIIDGKLPPHLKGPDVIPKPIDLPDTSPSPTNVPQGDPTAPIHDMPQRPDESIDTPETSGTD